MLSREGGRWLCYDRQILAARDAFCVYRWLFCVTFRTFDDLPFSTFVAIRIKESWLATIYAKYL
ncbi:MAG: hypothetical protein M1587_06740 [Thaumarchaeota archaeon]|nr:hypothetical protein [Nitrososphaerota archaeon]